MTPQRRRATPISNEEVEKLRKLVDFDPERDVDSIKKGRRKKAAEVQSEPEQRGQD